MQLTSRDFPKAALNSSADEETMWTLTEWTRVIFCCALFIISVLTIIILAECFKKIKWTCSKKPPPDIYDEKLGWVTVTNAVREGRNL